MKTISGLSTYQRILDGLAAPAPRPYTPAFRVEPGRWGWRVFDGETAIAVFSLQDGEYAFDLWQLSPFDAPIMANMAEPGAVYDLHTVHNTVLNLPITRCGDLCDGVTDYAACLTTEWVQDAGAELRVRIIGVFPQGRIQYDLRFFYDADRAQYRFFIDAEMWKLEPTGGEPINMMLAGALTDTAAARRWSHSLWADPQDGLKRIVHSNALFQATDYGDSSGRWRSKNAPLDGAWIAYAAHPVFNPAMLVREANVPVYFATCSQLFDEHLIWQSAGLDELVEGYFHFVMRTEFVNLPAALATEFLAQAADPPKPSQWRVDDIALPFHIGVVNSFEERANPWQPEDCPLIILADPACWATDAVHSGSRSIKLTGRSFHSWQRQMPTGAVCFVESQQRYRFSGWIKTQGVERFARLELATFEYTYNNTIDFARSAQISGDSDWTYVEAILDSGEEAYVMPYLALYGKGMAWFDDVKLEKV